ncbi:MAG: universal stress protein [Gammaproteobacteria bacterium]
MKNILVPVKGGEGSKPLLDTAVSIARRFDAHIEFLHVRPDPQDRLPYGSLAIPDSMKQSILDSAERSADERTNRARHLCEEYCIRHDIPLVKGAPIGKLSASWREDTGRKAAIVAEHGRVHDLLIMLQPEGKPKATLECALTETGRPVLVVPRVEHRCEAANIGIGWNGSAEASRAVADAMPSVRSADHVTIFTTEKRERMPPTADELVTYLGCYGVNVTKQLLDTESRSVGEALLEESNAANVDMLVIGAYSGRTLRDVIFGGVTRHMLTSADVPVFMAH